MKFQNVPNNWKFRKIVFVEMGIHNKTKNQWNKKILKELPHNIKIKMKRLKHNENEKQQNLLCWKCSVVETAF